MMVGKDKARDIAASVLIAVFGVLMRLPVIGYPPAGDNKAYSLLAKSFFGQAGPVHIKYPPLYSAVSALFMLFNPDAYFATKLVNILFGSMAVAVLYLFLRRLRLGRAVSALLSLTVLFNPWFFYFTGVIGLSEGLTSFLLTLALFLLYLYFQEDRPLMLYLSAVSFGLAALTRIPVIAVLAVVYAYLGLKFLRGEKRFESAVFVLISFLPFLAWQVSNLFVKVQNSYLGYIRKSIVSYPHALIYFTLIVLPVTFLVMTYYLIVSAVERIRNRDAFWMIVVFSMIVHTMLVILAWDLVNHVHLISNPWSLTRFRINFNPLDNAVFAARYYVTLLPAGTALCAVYLNKRLRKPLYKAGLVLYVVFLLFAASFYSFGFLQNAVGGHVPLPSTFVQKSDSIAQVVGFIETHDNSAIYYIYFRNSSELTDYATEMSFALNRSSIGNVVTASPPSGAGDYIISDMGQDSLGVDAGIVFETRGRTRYYLYRVVS